MSHSYKLHGQIHQLQWGYLPPLQTVQNRDAQPIMIELASPNEAKKSPISIY